jgi:hypothetical protein
LFCCHIARWSIHHLHRSSYGKVLTPAFSFRSTPELLPLLRRNAWQLQRLAAAKDPCRAAAFADDLRAVDGTWPVCCSGEGR